MTAQDVVKLCYLRGVRLVIDGQTMRAKGRRGAVNDALKQGLAEHRQTIIDAYGDGIFPDESLPDTIIIPASVPNDEDAIRACIDSQRKERRAA
jgi:class 3 adenylate cyclase